MGIPPLNAGPSQAATAGQTPAPAVPARAAPVPIAATLDAQAQAALTIALVRQVAAAQQAGLAALMADLLQAAVPGRVKSAADALTALHLPTTVAPDAAAVKTAFVRAGLSSGPPGNDLSNALSSLAVVLTEWIDTMGSQTAKSSGVTPAAEPAQDGAPTPADTKRTPPASARQSVSSNAPTRAGGAAQMPSETKPDAARPAAPLPSLRSAGASVPAADDPVTATLNQRPTPPIQADPQARATPETIRTIIAQRVEAKLSPQPATSNSTVENASAQSEVTLSKGPAPTTNDQARQKLTTPTTQTAPDLRQSAPRSGAADTPSSAPRTDAAQRPAGREILDHVQRFALRATNQVLTGTARTPSGDSVPKFPSEASDTGQLTKAPASEQIFRRSATGLSRDVGGIAQRKTANLEIQDAQPAAVAAAPLAAFARAAAAPPVPAGRAAVDLIVAALLGLDAPALDAPTADPPLKLQPETVSDPARQAARPMLPPPFRGGPLSPQPEATPILSADADPASTASHLLSATSGALARQTLLQIASLPDALTRNNSAQWMFEIPLLTPQGCAAAHVVVERDASHQGTEAQPPVWRVQFAVDVEPLGPVRAGIAVSGERTWVTLTAERPESLEKMRAGIGQLHEALRAESLSAEIAFQSGFAPEPPARPAEFVDRAL